MKIKLVRKFFSWKWRYCVTDERKNSLYFISIKMGKIGREIFVYCKDKVRDDEYIACIREMFSVFFSPLRYTVEIDGQVVCEMVQKPTLTNSSLAFEGMRLYLYENDVLIRDKFVLRDDDNVIMNMSKFYRCYGLDVINSEKALFCICVALVVDCATARSWGTRSTSSL